MPLPQGAGFGVASLLASGVILALVTSYITEKVSIRSECSRHFLMP